MAKKVKEEVSDTVQKYLVMISSYEREFKKWESRVEKILKRYRDDDKPSNKTQTAQFNILWSNVQTLVPATFSKLPQPDVSRRFRDNDPIGRVASLILERALDFEIQHYADYRTTLKQCVHDRFLGGRGTAWVRYEPHFKQAEAQSLPEDGTQVTEDTDETPLAEQLDYECAPLDYVHWRDFGHSVARTWEEVTVVWRNVYMDEGSVEERFGEEIAKKIPYDATPEDLKKGDKYGSTVKKQALVIEIWDKEEGKAYWINKSMKEVLDERDDPLGLHEFFPCPRPLYATLTNDSLVPVPDFVLYQDQANELNIYADRIDGLTRMLQLKGVYDGAADSSLGRLFTEGENGSLLPVKNWSAFAEKGGLKGQIDVYDLTPLVQALKTAQEGMEQVKQQVYEITGISDIVRGQTMASETATAQQIKGQYASLRLRSYQDEVSQFATECLRLKAQIMCAKFNPQTLAAISAADQLQPADKALVYPPPPMPAAMPGQPQPVPAPQMAPDAQQVANGPAMALLVGPERLQDPEAEAPNPLRSFRIDIAADTLVQLDEQAQQKAATEFLTGIGGYLQKAAEVGGHAPPLVPALVELLKWGAVQFKVGKQIEGTLDQALDNMKQQALAPKAPPPPPPEVQVAQIRAQSDMQASQQKVQADMQVEGAKAQREQQQEALIAQREAAQAEVQAQREDAFNRWKVQEDNATKVLVAQISAKAGLDAAALSAEQAADAKVTEDLADGGSIEAASNTARRQRPIDQIAKMHADMMAAHSQGMEMHGKTLQALTGVAEGVHKAAAAMAAPRAAIRGPDGKITHSVPVTQQ